MFLCSKNECTVILFKSLLCWRDWKPMLHRNASRSLFHSMMYVHCIQSDLGRGLEILACDTERQRESSSEFSDLRSDASSLRNTPSCCICSKDKSDWKRNRAVNRNLLFSMMSKTTKCELSLRPVIAMELQFECFPQVVKNHLSHKWMHSHCSNHYWCSWPAAEKCQ